MSAAMVGADAAELERVAHSLRVAADELDGHAASVTTILRSVAWVGGVAARFESEWTGGHRQRLRSTAVSIRTAATDLDRNAAEQRQASRIGDSSATGTGSIDRIGGALDRLDVTHELIGVAAELVDDLADHGAVGRFVDLLTHEDFVGFLDGAGHVLDVGTVVVDAIADFADHPDLAFDERIVHALSDVAVRFGLTEGTEQAAEWLAGAATAALMPGFGAVLAPFAGGLAGVLADTVMGAVVGAADGATDFVDLAADTAVAAYREAKEVFGVVADVARAAADVTGDALDLADAAAAALVDTGADLVGSLNPFD
jgi:hypothetical protein